jgi:hypothetical protein
MIRVGNGAIRRATGLVAASVLAFSGLSVVASGAAVADPASPKVIFTAPASAQAKAKAPEDCPADYLCVFYDNDFFGDMAGQPVTDAEWPPGTCGNVVDEVAGQVTSIVNNTGRHVSFFYDAGCQGDHFIVPPGGQVSYVGDLYNDHVLSVQV